MIPVPGEAIPADICPGRLLFCYFCFVIFVIALIFQNGNPYNSIML